MTLACCKAPWRCDRGQCVEAVGVDVGSIFFPGVGGWRVRRFESASCAACRECWFDNRTAACIYGMTSCKERAA